MVPRISPLAARSRLTARATAAKIRLWRIKHRRVQTAAEGLMPGIFMLWDLGGAVGVIIHAAGFLSLYPRAVICSSVCHMSGGGTVSV